MTTATEDTNTDVAAENTASEEAPNDTDELYEEAQIVEDYDDPDDETTPSGEVSEGDTPTPEETEDQVADEDEDDSREPVEGTTVPTPAFGEELLIAAQGAGLPENVARAFGTPDNLRAFLASRTPEQGAPVQQQAPTEETPAKFDHGLTDELVGEDVIKAFDRVGEYVDAKLARFEESMKPLREIEGTVRRQSEQAATQAFDAAIDGLGKEDLFGKGHQSRGTEQHTARSQVAEAWNDIVDSRHRRGLPPLRPETLAKRAYYMAYGDQVKADARTQVAAKVTKRSKQVLARPQSRNGQQLNAIDTAVQRMHEFKRAMIAEDAAGYEDAED